MTPMVPPNPQPTPDPELVRLYEESAREYYRSLPPEDTIDPTNQATMRQSTIMSFAMIEATRPDLQCFNELLVRYPRPGSDTPGRVVPNNLVVVHPGPLELDDAFDVAEQPARPFLAIDYITEYRNPAAYEHNFDRYQSELRVPYYLRVYPDEKRFDLFRLTDGSYAAVSANEHGRYPVPEIELEIGFHDEWLRYWFRGELVPTPAELYRKIRLHESELAAVAERQAAEQRAAAAEQRAVAAEAENARLREELAKAQGQG